MHGGQDVPVVVFSAWGNSSNTLLFSDLSPPAVPGLVRRQLRRSRIQMGHVGG